MSGATKISSADRRQRGSVAVVMAASLTFLFALGALAVDAGFMYTHERSLQAVADAAALAGGQGFINGTSTAEAIAMATQNGYTDGVAGNTVSVTSPATRQIQVTISSAQAPIFGHIFGLGSKTMTATSIAAAAPLDPAIWAGEDVGRRPGWPSVAVPSRLPATSRATVRSATTPGAATWTPARSPTATCAPRLRPGGGRSANPLAASAKVRPLPIRGGTTS